MTFIQLSLSFRKNVYLSDEEVLYDEESAAVQQAFVKVKCPMIGMELNTTSSMLQMYRYDNDDDKIIIWEKHR